MRVVALRLRPERWVGSLTALFHATYIGMAIKQGLNDYYLGMVPDLEFHGFTLPLFDPPVALFAVLVLKPLGFNCGNQNIWDCTVIDLTYLVLGTMYWFAVGYVFTLAFRGRLRNVLSKISPKMSAARTLFGLVLLTTLFVILLFTTRLSDLLAYYTVRLLTVVWFLVVPAFVAVFGLYRILSAAPASRVDTRS